MRTAEAIAARADDQDATEPPFQETLRLLPGSPVPDFGTVVRLCRSGLRFVDLTSVQVDVSIDGSDPERGIRLLACLRDLTACGVHVGWRAGPGIQDSSGLLVHVAPPIEDASSEIMTWRTVHRYGLCYWRRGPGFIAILDRRDPGSSNQYVLDTEGHIGVFGAAEHPIRRASLEVIDPEALDELEREGLVLSRGGWSVALPFRVAHWPVPFNAI